MKCLSVTVPTQRYRKIRISIAIFQKFHFCKTNVKNCKQLSVLGHAPQDCDSCFFSKYTNRLHGIFYLFFPSLNFGKFFWFKPRIILKFLNTKGVTSPKNSRNLFQSLLIFYYIIKLDKSLYYVSITLKYIWKQYITMIKKFICLNEA